MGQGCLGSWQDWLGPVQRAGTPRKERLSRRAGVVEPEQFSGAPPAVQPRAGHLGSVSLDFCPEMGALHSPDRRQEHSVSWRHGAGALSRCSINTPAHLDLGSISSWHGGLCNSASSDPEAFLIRSFSASKQPGMWPNFTASRVARCASWGESLSSELSTYFGLFLVPAPWGKIVKLWLGSV